MKNDQKIVEKVKSLRGKVDRFLNYVEKLNQCAYSDGLLEDIVRAAKELEELMGE